MMDTDEGQNIMPLIFQTEVESLLERLELLIDEQPSSLKSELIVMAQELGGLGEMLDLPSFVQLCASVEHYANSIATHTQLKEVSHQALQIWRRAQALVLTDNVEAMPTELTNVSFGLIAIEFDEPQDEVDTSAESVFAGFDIDIDIEDEDAVDLPLDDNLLALGTEDEAVSGTEAVSNTVSDAFAERIDNPAPQPKAAVSQIALTHP